MIRNPILPGFNPDPSICRVGDDYYIATSTFEWFPGVQIHHSRDLANWHLIGRPLNRASQLDMRGDPDSCGIWAPDISHDGERFWLIYTDVKRYGRTTVGGASGASLRDFHNYLVTCDTVDGDWSDPVHLNSSGFDPSLFHDDDGRKYVLNQLWDHRPGRSRFAGIVLQEYSPEEGRLTGARTNIFPGTALGLTEAPHLYKRTGWYYLLVAEGGTGWNHAVTMARSRDLRGPYELHPDGQVLTSRTRPDVALQRAGHADLVETPDGRTFMAYLCGRPLPNRGRCVLGRETAIQPMRWGDDDWLYTEDGSGMPVLAATSLSSLHPGEGRGPVSADKRGHPAVDPDPQLGPGLRRGDDQDRYSDPPPSPPRETEARYDFDQAELPLDLQWLRTPEPDRIFSLTARPGYLRLYGRETIGSLFTQALVARRQQDFCYSASCALDFAPEHFQQAAGLVAYYNGSKFHYLHVSHDEAAGRHIRVMSALPDSPQADAFTPPFAIPAGRIELRVEVDYERLRFAFRVEGADWTWLPEQFDASILSDEATQPGLPNFTGAFVGMACQDMAGTGRPADFDWFDYRERAYREDPAQD